MDVILKYFADFSETQLEQFGALHALYTEWNAKINVVSRKGVDALYEKHVLHSLAIAAACTFKPGTRVVDVGTGGGFPGIPLAVFFPEVDFTLVDSIGKKIKVVDAVVEGAGLRNVRAVHGRAEDLPEKNGYDFAVSRAVAPLGTLWTWVKPLLRVGHGSEEYRNGLICLKGGDLTDEIAESGLKPRALPVQQLFAEPHFADKYVLYVPR